MKVIIGFLFIISANSYSFDIKLLPNPFLSFGNQKIFEENSSKWIERFAQKAIDNEQYYKALHAWCYLNRSDYSKSKAKIIWLLEKLNKPQLKYLFFAHYADLEDLYSAGSDTKFKIFNFLKYLEIREKMFRGFVIPDKEFRSNKYALSEYFYHKVEFQNLKYYLNRQPSDPHHIFNYHRTRLAAIQSDFNYTKKNKLMHSDYFMTHVKAADRLNYGLENNDQKPILIDAEHINLLIENENYIPDVSLIKKYPFLLLGLILKPDFKLTDDHWYLLFKLINNSFWIPKINFILNNNSRLKNTLGRNLSYIFPKIFPPTNKRIEEHSYLLPGLRFIYSNDMPKPLLKNIFNSAKDMNLGSRSILPIRWLDIDVPFIFDPIEFELIVSLSSIFWSKKVWQAVIHRSQLHHKLLKQSSMVGKLNDALPPLWLIDSIVNSRTNWTPELHGFTYQQVQYLSLFPLSLDSLYNASRNRSRKNLFYTYHWQCKILGEALFDSMRMSEILSKIQQLNVSKNNPRLLYQRLSIYFNTSLQQLKRLVPQ